MQRDVDAYCANDPCPAQGGGNFVIPPFYGNTLADQRLRLIIEKQRRRLNAFVRMGHPLTSKAMLRRSRRLDAILFTGAQQTAE